jgi:N-acetylneuraminic acid mutarotase
VQKANFSGGGRYLATGLSIGNKGYVVSGVSDTSNAMKDNWEYDPVADTWTQKANFEGAGRSAAIGFSIGGNGYVGLGYGLNSPAYYLTDFWQYDTAADSWVEKSDFPAGALDGAFTFVISDMGYVGTGADSIGKTHSNFCKYNSLTDQWTQKDSFGGGMRAWASGFSIGNNGYAGIGTPSNIENCMKDFWMYTPDSIATGIKSIDDNSIVIYPNPVSDKIHITSISNTFFSISDMAGQSWQVQIIGNEIDVSDLPSGVYCLRLQNSDGFLISKFTKL